jgi:hypothetical protein
MNNENKAEGIEQAAELDNASLEGVKGGATTAHAAFTNRAAVDSLIKRTAVLKVADLFGRNLLIDKIAASNTDWQ